MLQTRKLPNGTTDVRCTLCGYSEAVIDLSAYRCFCPRPAVEASHLQEEPISEDMGNLVETEVNLGADEQLSPKDNSQKTANKPKRRRVKKPVATES